MLKYDIANIQKEMKREGKKKQKCRKGEES